jgi:hypothetical protein
MHVHVRLHAIIMLCDVCYLLLVLVYAGREGAPAG